jgi:hypothetical protein
MITVMNGWSRSARMFIRPAPRHSPITTSPGGLANKDATSNPTGLDPAAQPVAGGSGATGDSAVMRGTTEPAQVGRPSSGRQASPSADGVCRQTRRVAGMIACILTATSAATLKNML